MVVMVPLTILNASFTTLTIGARQLVVQEALEIMLCFAGSYLSWLTPSTRVTSSFFAGAEMMTFFTVPRRCFLASSALVKCPVDSITTCAPTLSHGSAPGSRSLKTLIVLPSTVMPSGPAETLLGRLPSTESYFSSSARVFRSVKSLTTTISRFESCNAVRKTFLPIRPNPLIPTLMAILPPNKTQLRDELPTENLNSMGTENGNRQKQAAAN